MNGEAVGLEPTKWRSAATTLKWAKYSQPSGPWVSGTTTINTLQERMTSVDHYPLNTEIDDGGIFFLERFRDAISPGITERANFRGEFTVGSPGVAWTPLPEPSVVPDSTLRARGTTAIARTEPTNPAFSAPVAVGEVLREGLPSMVGVQTWKNKTQVARSAGSEYLGIQFGWIPFVSDLRQFAKAVTDSEKILESYHKGSGKKIRRRYAYPSERSTRLYTQGFIPVPQEIGVFLSGTRSETTVSEMWFSGAFKYHVPIPTGTMGKIHAWASDARKLLGIELTPEVVWNLAPWTWAVDWFTNTGDVMHNISAMGRDGLVLQYGYIMARNQRIMDSTAWPENGPKVSTSRRVEKTILQRMPATPFGFGFNLNSLTAKQASILVALGLSRT